MAGARTHPIESTLEMTAGIVSAYVSRNHLQPFELSGLISNIHASLTGLGSSTGAKEAGPPKATAPEIRSSVSRDYLISFENGKPYKTLRRHLTLRGLSPEQYRVKWGLAPNYPMTAQTYSEQRSKISLALGLGLQRRNPAVAAHEHSQH